MDLAFIALVISIFASRLIQLNAFKNLAEEDKSKVLSKKILLLSQISLVFTIIIVAIFYFFIYNYRAQSSTLTTVFFVFLLLQRIFVYTLIRKKMIADNVAKSYRNKYFLSWLVTTTGVAVFIFLFLMQFNNAVK